MQAAASCCILLFRLIKVAKKHDSHQPGSNCLFLCQIIVSLLVFEFSSLIKIIKTPVSALTSVGENPKTVSAAFHYTVKI